MGLVKIAFAVWLLAIAAMVDGLAVLSFGGIALLLGIMDAEG